MSEPLVPNLTRVSQLQEALQAAALREAWLTARLERLTAAVREVAGPGWFSRDLADARDYLRQALGQDT